MQLVKWNSLKDCTVFEGVHLTNPKGGIIPARIIPAGIIPARIITAGIIPAGMTPAGMIPAGMISAGLEEFRAIEIESMCERIHANPWKKCKCKIF